jgi:hypothetical protein
MSNRDDSWPALRARALEALGIDRPQHLLPLQRKKKLGEVFANLIYNFLEIEERHISKGVERTSQDVRDGVARCLEQLAEAIVFARALYPNGNFNPEYPANGRLNTPLIMPLYILFNELQELNEGRQSKLFEVNADRGRRTKRNYLHVTIRATAAAAVQALNEIDVLLPDAERKVSEALFSCGFGRLDDCKEAICAGTIHDWRKNRATQKHPFLDIYEKHLAIFRSNQVTEENILIILKMLVGLTAFRA